MFISRLSLPAACLLACVLAPVAGGPGEACGRGEGVGVVEHTGGVSLPIPATL